jgi:group I intron endonuclease
MNGLKKIYTIYKHTNTVNNACYIGYTIKTIEQRWSQHVRAARRNESSNKFQAGIRKYGAEAFVSERLDIVDTIEEACKLEMFYISKFNSFKHGYNSTIGGENPYNWSDEQRDSKGITMKEAFETGILISPFSDSLIHAKAIATREARGTNVRTTNNPMWDPEKVARKVAKTSGANHFSAKKYMYYFFNAEGIRYDIIKNASLEEKLAEFNISLSTFNKYCNTNRSPISGTAKGMLFYKELRIFSED